MAVVAAAATAAAAAAAAASALGDNALRATALQYLWLLLCIPHMCSSASMYVMTTSRNVSLVVCVCV